MTKSKIVSLIAVFVLGIFGLSLAPIATHATGVCDQQEGVSPEVWKANGCDNTGEGSANDLTNTIVGIINGIVGVLAIVAVIFVVVGGVNYMTSQGDPGKTKKAKDTILYATIGLIIAVLAFAIVNFVITKVINNAGDGNTSNSSSSTSGGTK